MLIHCWIHPMGMDTHGFAQWIFDPLMNFMWISYVARLDWIAFAHMLKCPVGLDKLLDLPKDQSCSIIGSVHCTWQIIGFWLMALSSNYWICHTDTFGLVTGFSHEGIMQIYIWSTSLISTFWFLRILLPLHSTLSKISNRNKFLDPIRSKMQLGRQN